MRRAHRRAAGACASNPQAAAQRRAGCLQPELGAPGPVLATQGRTQTLVDAAEKAQLEGMALRTRRVQLALQQQVGPEPAAVGIVQPGLRGLYTVTEAGLAIFAPAEVRRRLPEL